MIALGGAVAMQAKEMQAQELTGTARQRVLETARSRYYNLTGLGVKSFTCGVNFDLDTLSKGFLPAGDIADRALLQTAVFTLKVTSGGPTLKFQFPDGAQSQSEDVVAGATLWISELVQGFFQTWPLKGFAGPIPHQEKQLLGVAQDGEGYRITVKGPAGPMVLHLDRNSMVTEIQSQNGTASQIDEHPIFTSAPEGMVLTGNDTQDTEPNGTTRARYAIDIGRVDGFMIPQRVRLLVGEHVDVKFALSGCKVATAKR
ncbi:hypothetical protein AciX9_3471 [Granulicella tundricola MP5ACTX9]|uniref:Uncharacterized protein n=2 Tax=Granulicella TaxID=940557 RepID=E8X3W8_GRATM|nr:hypothetical protein AciX9_3471 [Granulicella tundricola MP5ACTX9]